MLKHGWLAGLYAAGGPEHWTAQDGGFVAPQPHYGPNTPVSWSLPGLKGQQCAGSRLLLSGIRSA